MRGAAGIRFYSPSAQRWVNRDPVGEAGGINLYGLVENRPTHSYDSLGEQRAVVVEPGKGPVTDPLQDRPRPITISIGEPVYTNPNPPVIVWNPQFPQHHCSLDKDAGVQNTSGNAPPVRPSNPNPCTTLGEKRNPTPTVVVGTCPSGKPRRCFSYEECQNVTSIGLKGTVPQRQWVKVTKCFGCD